MTRTPEQKKELKHELLGQDSKFRFSCNKDIKCFTKCCRKVDLLLTPYDIVRIKNRLSLSSEEFLKKYTSCLIWDSGVPVVVLNMVDDERRSCPFVGEDGCEIYEDRPWSCRLFPLRPENSKDESYTLIDDPNCLGYKADREWTVKEWMENQGVNIYNELEAFFRDIKLKENIENEDLRRMFYMACYDMDRFRRFVFETKFLDVFDIENGVIRKIKKDDVELLKLAMNWLKFGLADPEALKVKEEVLAAKIKEQKKK